VGFCEIINSVIGFVKSKEVKAYAGESTENFASIILSEDPVSIGKQVVATGKLLFSIPDIIFWDKMQRFLSGVYVDYEAQLKMCRKFDNDEKYADFTKRQIHILNELDDDKKVDFFANLTQAVLLELIDLPLYFKLATVLKVTTREELDYLSANIKRRESVIDVYMVSLLQNGLVMKYDQGRGFWMDEPYNDTYDFTSLAQCLDMFAIEFRNEQKYRYSGMTKLQDLTTVGLNQAENAKRFLASNGKTNKETIERIRQTIPVPMSVEEVDGMINEIFGDEKVEVVT